MDLAETVSYVKHHLQLDDRSDPLFSDDGGRRSVQRRHRRWSACGRGTAELSVS